MIIDPDIAVIQLRQHRGGNDELCWRAADLIEQIIVPQHDAWLKAKPPCPTCGGKGGIFIEHDNGGEYARNEWDQEVCPDCPESPGVLPFDKWVVTRLLATWEAVHGGVPYDYPMLGRQMLDKLREIGGTQ